MRVAGQKVHSCTSTMLHNGSRLAPTQCKHFIYPYTDRRNDSLRFEIKPSQISTCNNMRPHPNGIRCSYLRLHGHEDAGNVGEGTRDRADICVCGCVQKRTYITVKSTAAQAQSHTSLCLRPLLATRQHGSEHISLINAPQC
jgi:hypothetical protein